MCINNRKKIDTKINNYHILSQKMVIKQFFLYSLLLFWIFTFSQPAAALEPDELLVIANKKYAGSIELAHFYMQKRNIPPKNIIIVNTTTEESCSRESYTTEIENPLRDYLKQNPGMSRAIRCVVLMYGMPLRILPTDQQDDNQKTDRASVDSEFALVRVRDYLLEGWILNPFFLHYQKRNGLTVNKGDVLMVCRIDGPTLDIAKRIINDSIDVEKAGLSGKAYLDARWPYPDIKPVGGYATYDYAIHRSARVLEQSNKIMVVIGSMSCKTASSK
jgi:uncharacterized protein (TIGR03790 family)